MVFHFMVVPKNYVDLSTEKVILVMLKDITAWLQLSACNINVNRFPQIFPLTQTPFAFVQHPYKSNVCSLEYTHSMAFVIFLCHLVSGNVYVCDNPVTPRGPTPDLTKDSPYCQYNVRQSSSSHNVQVSTCTLTI